jgi:hypothetical protein
MLARCGRWFANPATRDQWVSAPIEGIDQITCESCRRMMIKSWPHTWTPLNEERSKWLATHDPL